jgi:hypothetical protein
MHNLRLPIPLLSLQSNIALPRWPQTLRKRILRIKLRVFQRRKEGHCSLLHMTYGIRINGVIEISLVRFRKAANDEDFVVTQDNEDDLSLRVHVCTDC